MSDASHKSVPEWAIERVRSLSECQDVLVCPIGTAFAEYIAQHEGEPVDPLIEALNAAFWCDSASELDAANVREELAKRGLKIVEASK